jgi:hypothetical protein
VEPAPSATSRITIQFVAARAEWLEIRLLLAILKMTRWLSLIRTLATHPHVDPIQFARLTRSVLCVLAKQTTMEVHHTADPSVSSIPIVLITKLVSITVVKTPVLTIHAVLSVSAALFLTLPSVSVSMAIAAMPLPNVRKLLCTITRTHAITIRALKTRNVR